MWISENFTSLEDRLQLNIKGYSDGGYWVLFGHCKDGSKKTLHRQDVRGALNVSFEFDPISLGVYEGAESFSVEVEGECRIDHWSLTIPENDTHCGDVFAKVENGMVGIGTKDNAKTISIIPKKVLYIGNSLLLGMYDTYGMCSTAPDKDYYHIVSEAILERSPDCVLTKLRGSFLEQATSTEEYQKAFLCEKDTRLGITPAECFTDDLDLIFVQLMDNVNNPEKLAAFKQNAPVFLDAVRERCPNARIMWVYGWYMKPDVLPTILDICGQRGVETVNISPAHIKENEAYSGQISVVPGAEPAVVPDLWISHPGDGGMKAISEIIIKRLFPERS